MALDHAKPGQPIDISPLGDALRHSATHAILKTHALELMRVVLRRGEDLPPHSVPGESTLLCLEGTVEVDTHTEPLRLQAGHLVLIAAGERHSIRAIEDSSLLRTVQVPTGAPGSGSSTA